MCLATLLSNFAEWRCQDIDQVLLHGATLKAGITERGKMTQILKDGIAEWGKMTPNPKRCIWNRGTGNCGKSP